MTQRHAEIVGAGFAGLTAACALAQRGWSVRVHERADRLRTTGAGIYIYENGLRVLEAVGAYAAATHGAPFAHTREVRDDQNRVISVHRWQGSRVFSIVRQTVINALAESATLSGAEIVLNSDGGLRHARRRTDHGRRPHDQGRSGGRRRRHQLEAARQPRPPRQAQISGRRLHAAPDRQDAGGDGRRRRHHGRILVRQPPRALHAVQRDRGLYRADHARQRRGGEGNPGQPRGLEALVSASRNADRPHPRGGPLRPLRIHQAEALVGRQGRGDRRRRACDPAEHRAGRRLRHDERAVAGGLSRPRARHAGGARHLGGQRARHHRPHPAHLADARLADDLAAVSSAPRRWRWRANRNGWCASAPKPRCMFRRGLRFFRTVTALEIVGRFRDVLLPS